jgi:hypothetical protein
MGQFPYNYQYSSDTEYRTSQYFDFGSTDYHQQPIPQSETNTSSRSRPSDHQLLTVTGLLPFRFLSRAAFPFLPPGILSHAVGQHETNTMPQRYCPRPPPLLELLSPPSRTRADCSLSFGGAEDSREKGILLLLLFHPPKSDGGGRRVMSALPPPSRRGKQIGNIE